MKKMNRKYTVNLMTDDGKYSLTHTCKAKSWEEAQAKAIKSMDEAGWGICIVVNGEELH